MRHKIGFNYSDVLRSRKTKRDLPLIGRLNYRVDIAKLQTEIGELLSLREKNPAGGFATFDPASSEHNYHLKTSKGESFIRNYDDFYRQYSMIGFQELSDDAKAHAARTPFSVGDLTPSMRLRGMKDTGHAKYHPLYDERNYTKKTQFYRGAVADVLDGFAAEPCRTALVCLRPHEYISPHFDIGPEFITRVMVPVFTNPGAVVGVKVDGGYQEFHIPADGGVYFINSGFEHYAINQGDQPRYQIRVCLNGQEDLEGMRPLAPERFISDAEFMKHPCAPQAPAEPAAENILLQTLNEFHLNKSGGARLT